MSDAIALWVANSFDRVVDTLHVVRPRKQNRRRAALNVRSSLVRKVLREYSDRRALDRGAGVEQIGRDLFDDISVGQKLRLPGGTQGAPHAGKFVHRGVTDLTFNRFAVVKHGKPERQSFEVVSPDFATRQRHRNIPQRFPKPFFSLIVLSRKWLA
jgi:hypothetical protein